MKSDQQVQTIPSFVKDRRHEDEISLVDIVKVLLRRKKLILGITTVSVCLGLIYAFSQQRVYQVDTIVLPPSFENIQALNVLESSSVNSSSVFASFMEKLNSRRFKKAFFDEAKILETLSVEPTKTLTEKNKNDIFESFFKGLSIKKAKISNSTQITLEGTHKEKIGVWLDSLVIMGNLETKKQLVSDLQSKIDSKVKNINRDIFSKRSIYKKVREGELGRLEEDLQIAQNLGIHEHLFVPNVDGKSPRDISSELNDISNRLSNANNLSSYMKGTKVLQAEITALKNRKSDDVHIAGLRDLQEQLTRLEAIKIEKDKLQTVIVDRKASVYIEPIGPNRKLIVILSFFLGGILGLFSVFVLEFIVNLKSGIDNEPNIDLVKS